VEAFHCPGKHSHRDDEDAPGNCGEGTCQTALLDAEDDTLKRIGRFIDPTAVGTWIGNLDETGVKDGAGQITWGRYFKSATREIKVYPVQDLPDGETVP
jgi:hypothetical protein